MTSGWGEIKRLIRQLQCLMVLAALHASQYHGVFHARNTNPDDSLSLD